MAVSVLEAPCPCVTARVGKRLRALEVAVTESQVDEARELDGEGVLPVGAGPMVACQDDERQHVHVLLPDILPQ